MSHYDKVDTGNERKKDDNYGTLLKRKNITNIIPCNSVLSQLFIKQVSRRKSATTKTLMVKPGHDSLTLAKVQCTRISVSICSLCQAEKAAFLREGVKLVFNGVVYAIATASQSIEVDNTSQKLVLIFNGGYLISSLVQGTISFLVEDKKKSHWQCFFFIKGM